MSTHENVHIVKNAFAAMGRGDSQALLALCADTIEWIIPGAGWPLAGTHLGHTGVQALLRTAADTLETSFPTPPEFVAQGDRVMVIGVAQGRVKATQKTWQDHWVFAITVHNAKLTHIREYIDTQALALAAKPA